MLTKIKKTLAVAAYGALTAIHAARVRELQALLEAIESGSRGALRQVIERIERTTYGESIQ